jgi:hypothetical protein
VRELKSTGWIIAKAALFFFLGVLSAALVFLQNPNLKVLVLLGIMVWSFCRLYYFAFYVIHRYVDPSSRFSGLWFFARDLMQKKFKIGKTVL